MPLHLPNKPFSPTAKVARIMRSGGKGLVTKAPVSFESISKRPLVKVPKPPKPPRP